jgi:hypothetical protein
MGAHTAATVALAVAAAATMLGGVLAVRATPFFGAALAVAPAPPTPAPATAAMTVSFAAAKRVCFN